MAHAPLHTVVRHLRSVVGTAAGPAPTDTELLERFARQRDAAAFELLVWRHQRMVYGVCRRVLHDAHDAEDAFQATFLTLVRKAACIKKGQALAGWLYQVAYRIAWRAQAGSDRRRRREQPAADLSLVQEVQPSAADVHQRELAPLLDGELQRLPAKYRSPIVLCYLEGKTYDEAAEVLGCPKGTLSTRLTRARELLRAQLERRGLTLPAAVLATALSAEAASAAAPAVLVAATVKTIATAGAASARVVALTEGVLQAMFWTKVKCVLSVTLAVLVLGTAGVVLVPGQSPTGQIRKPDENDLAAGKVGLPTVDQPGAEDPPATWQLRTKLQMPEAVHALAVSPDGKILAGGGYAKGAVRLWELTTGKEIAILQGVDAPVLTVTFSPDGRTLATTGQSQTKGKVDSWVLLWDVASRKILATLGEPDAALVYTKFSPDGRFLGGINNHGTVKVWAVPDGSSTKLREILGGRIGILVYAPDGKTLAATKRDENAVFLVDAETGKVVRQFALAQEPAGLAFSPDGKSLAVFAPKGKEASKVRVWDVTTGKVRHEVQADKDTVRSVTFSPDGRMLATGGHDHLVKIWDAATGKLLAVLTGHQGPVVVILFGKDGATLITGSSDHTIRIWTLGNAEAAKVEPVSPVGNRLDALLHGLLKAQKTDEQIVEALFLATMARLPNDVESRLMLKHVATKKDRHEAFTDVLWALVNSLEFHTNVEELRKQDPRQKQ